MRELVILISIIFFLLISNFTPGLSLGSENADIRFPVLEQISPVIDDGYNFDDIEFARKGFICDYPDQVDSRGRRCGNRAASIRMRGRLGGKIVPKPQPKPQQGNFNLTDYLSPETN